MKSLFILTSFILSTISFAEESFPIILTIEFPPNPMMNVQQLRKVEVEGSGKVVESIITYTGGNTTNVTTRSLPQLTGKILEKLQSCTGKLSRYKFRPKASSFCTDNAGTHYKVLKDHNFALRLCGHLQTIPGKCSQDIVKLLDKLASI